MSEITNEIGQTIKPLWSEVGKKYPQGIIMPATSLLALDSGGIHFGAYRFFDIYPLLATFHDQLRQQKTVARSSTVTDIVEFAAEGRMSRPLLKRLIPWRFYEDIADLSATDRVLFDRFISASDIDYRIQTNDIAGWTDQLITNTQKRYRIKPKDIQLSNHDGVTTTEMKINTIIRAWPRTNLAQMSTLSALAIGETSHHPVIYITYGKWSNGIPFAEYKLIARSNYEYDDITLLNLGIAPTPDCLPEDLKNADTRTSTSVNSWDRTTAQIRFQIPPQFQNELPNLQPDVYLPANNISIHPSGLVSPALGGFWQEGMYIQPGQGQPWKPHILDDTPLRAVIKKMTGNTYPPAYFAVEPFFQITPDALHVISQSLKLGKEFGTKSAQETFLEYLRSRRKSTRYYEMDQNRDTEKTRALIKGEVVFADTTLANKLATEIIPGSPSQWQLAASQEMLTQVFYAPYETIQQGTEDRYQQYFPNWWILENIQGSLLNRETTKDRLYKEAHMQDLNGDGWHQVIVAIREKFLEHPEIKNMTNDLSLVFRLFSTDPASAFQKL